MEHKLYSVAQVAERLGMSVPWVYLRISENDHEICKAAMRLGKRYIKFDADKIHEFIHTGKITDN